MGRAGSDTSLFTAAVTCQSIALYTAEHLSRAMHYSPLTAAARHTPVSPRRPEAGVLSRNAAVLQVDVVPNRGPWIGCVIQEHGGAEGGTMLAITPPMFISIPHFSTAGDEYVV